MADYVQIGRLGKTFGLKGEIKCFSLTSFPNERFKEGNAVSLMNQATGERLEATIRSVRQVGETYYLSFLEYPGIENAQKLVNLFVEMKREEAALPFGYYRLDDLKGLRVIDENGKPLGTIEEVVKYAPIETVFAKTDEGKRFSFPFLFERFVLAIDLESKTMKIKVMDGML